MIWKLKAIVQEVIDLLRKEIKEIFSSEEKLKVLSAKIGLDKPVKLTYLNTIISTLQGPVTIYFILRCLTPKEQGIWYAFYNLAALTIFAELGFANLISQRVSHIYAGLEFKNGCISGPQGQTDQLFSLIRFSIKFYLTIIVVAVLLLGTIGYLYFGKESNEIFTAFLLYSLFGGGKLLVSLLQSIYQGFNKVADIQTNVLISSLIYPLAMWILLSLGINIWALTIASGVNVILLLFLLYRVAPNFWSQALNYSIINKFAWFAEILPVQGKYALSSLSSYLIFYLYVPAVYKLENKVLAGKLGLTLSIVGAVFSFSAAWTWSKMPTFNILAARRQRTELMKLLRKSVIISSSFYIAGSLALLALIYIINKYHFYNDRFLDMYHMALILSYQFVVLLFTPVGIYLRAHNDDPWYIVSIMCAVLTTAAIIGILPYFGLSGLIVSINIINWFVLLPFGLKVYIISKRRYDLTWYNKLA